MKILVGNKLLLKAVDIKSVAFYLFSYHLVISGILTYNEYIGNLPAMPIVSAVFFGVPFMLFCLLYMTRLFAVKSAPGYLWRNVLFVVAAVYIAVVIWIYTGTFEFSVTSFNIFILLWYMVSFIVGSKLEIKSGTRNWILLLYLLMLANVFLNFNPAEGRISVNYDQLGICLFLGDSFAIWSLLTIAQYKKSHISVFFVLLSILGLYLISSRSSLYAFLFVLPFVFRKTNSLFIRLTFISAIAMAMVFFIINADELISGRMLNFIFTGDDHSFYLRQVIMTKNLDDLLNNWLLGDYAGQLRHGVFGFYIHNYLSLWRQFGFIPFFIFVMLLLPFFRWFIPWLRGKKFQEYDFLFYMIMFLLVEITFTRAYKSHFIWFAIGMISNIINEEYKKRVKRKSSQAQLSNETNT